MTEQKCKLWDAINRVVVASGGDSARVSMARQDAVVAVESALAELVEATIRERTCAECKSFERVDGREYGRCTNGDARTGGDYIDGIELPYADFGCIHWKERT